MEFAQCKARQRTAQPSRHGPRHEIWEAPSPPSMPSMPSMPFVATAPREPQAGPQTRKFIIAIMLSGLKSTHNDLMQQAAIKQAVQFHSVQWKEYPLLRLFVHENANVYSNICTLFDSACDCKIVLVGESSAGAVMRYMLLNDIRDPFMTSLVLIDDHHEIGRNFAVKLHSTNPNSVTCLNRKTHANSSCQSMAFHIPYRLVMHFIYTRNSSDISWRARELNVYQE